MNTAIDDDSSEYSWLNTWKGNPRDPETWQSFLEKHQPLILDWIQKLWGQDFPIQDHLAELYSFILKYVASIPPPPGRSFRGWLKKVLKEGILEWLAKMEKRKKRSRTKPDPLADFAEELAREIEIQQYQMVFSVALSKARLDVSPKTWKMFESAKIDKVAPREVSELFGVTPKVVYQSIKSVLERLRHHLQRMDEMPY